VLSPSDMDKYTHDPAPVWVFDFDAYKMLWANDAALEFWNASSHEEFVKRDYSSDSQAVRERLQQTADALPADDHLSESWTLFPDGTPTNVLLESRRLNTKTSTTLIVFRIVKILDFYDSDPDGLRMMLAARVTPVSVSMFDLQGRLISENPAGLSLRKSVPTWTEQAQTLSGRYCSTDIAKDICRAVDNDEKLSFEFRIPSADQNKIIYVNVRRVLDPVTAMAVAQITEEDITQATQLSDQLSKLNSDLEERVKRRSAELLELNRKLKQKIADAAAVQEELRRSQKFEAIGKLTGGIAHDFNNLLAVIQGNIDIIGFQKAFEPELTAEIERACERGAELTRSLLAYARQQPLHAAPIDLEACGREMLKLLQRTLGGNIDISLKTSVDLWPVFVDKGRFEDALLNLALNSRDAMPNGGSLSIELKNVTLSKDKAAPRSDEAIAGDFVAVSVTDSGQGMSKDVLSKAIDPFFTSRPFGNGSGLGLSMVYGFARQSGGDMVIDSKPGLGTIVELFLPRDTSNSEFETEFDSSESVLSGNGELIVLIEDEAAVRRVLELVLKSLNYQFISFESVEPAIEYFSNGKTADLVLTDIVLPGGKKGTDLAEIMQHSFPAIPVILMSGYQSDFLDLSKLDDNHRMLLSKPILRQKLATSLQSKLKAHTQLVP